MKTDDTFDLLVAGAGPAGSMAALHAAQGGLRVALVERKVKAGTPVRCGEAVGFKGFSASCAIDQKWILAAVRKIRMIAPSGAAVDLVNPAKIGNNYVVDREVMDYDLVQKAVACGAAYIPATTILSVNPLKNGFYTCTTTEREFHAQCVVLADGVESRLARGLGWHTALSPDDVESCAFCRVAHDAVDDATVEFHVGNLVAPGGFAWVFPRGGKRANVGLGVLGSKSEGGRAGELLRRFVEKRFPGAVFTHLHCGGVPVGRWLKPLVRGGVMIAGDAARQVNSLTGGGIAYALFAGKAAGETAVEALHNGKIDYNRLKRYQKKWSRYCGKQQMRSYALKQALLTSNSDRFFDTIAQSLAREPSEALSYRRVFFRTFAKHPAMLVKTFFLFR